MENQPKLNSSKEVIAYLAKQFPQCFIIEGEAKPLKIGIFQDLVARLDENSGVSKTQLRTALRLYTTSWRYLYGVKAGAVRIDLDGNTCEALEDQHVEHAKQQLAEAKARVQALRAEQRKQDPKATKKRVPPHNKKNIVVSAEKVTKPTKVDHAAKKVNSQPQVVPISKPMTNEEFSTVLVGQKVKVKVGQNAVDATILELVKGGARIELSSGLAMIVKAEHIHQQS